MKRILLLGLAAAFLMAAGSALAQDTPMYFDGGYHGTAWNGVETGFYAGSINGVNVGHAGDASPGMICDDYYDEITAGERWSATAYQVSSLNAGNIGSTLFGGDTFYITGGSNHGLQMTGLQGYTAMAYLVNIMFTTSPTASTQSYVSQALWYLTSNATTAGHGLSWSSIQSQAQTFVNAAIGADGGSLSQYANLWLYTKPMSPGGEQEMWGNVPVPEGGTAALYLLLDGLACAGAVWQSRGTARLEGRA
jgi:hypothetical protein